jgi:DNA-binding NtrC family response regulator
MPAHSSYPAVLIVDDEPLVLITLKVILEHEQFEVMTSSNPVQALKLVGERDFAVIISDHKMPEMMGLDFLTTCRRIRPHSSRILLTAVLNLASVMDAIAKGEICRFVSKPWLKEELVAAVRDGAERHELTANNFALQSETLRLEELLAAARLALAAK